MSVQSLSGLGANASVASNYRSTAQQTPATATPASAQGAAAKASDPVKEFLDYMKETPAQRFEDNWLAAHYLTREQYDAMPPQQREAIQKQMASELKEQAKQAAFDKPGKKGGILV
jgi:hypothetical protein